MRRGRSERGTRDYGRKNSYSDAADGRTVPQIKGGGQRPHYGHHLQRSGRRPQGHDRSFGPRGKTPHRLARPDRLLFGADSGEARRSHRIGGPDDLGAHGRLHAHHAGSGHQRDDRQGLPKTGSHRLHEEKRGHLLCSGGGRGSAHRQVRQEVRGHRLSRVRAGGLGRPHGGGFSRHRRH